MSALTPDMLRLALAAMVAGAWLLVAVRRRAAAAPAPSPVRAPGPGNADTLVLFASESGLARDLAQAHAARLGAEALPLDAIRPETLTGVARAWLLLASHGEGEAPRNGTAFAARLTTARPDLGGLRYGLLALGDRSYPTFCAFGRRVDAWLVERGATPLFPRVEVDRAAPADLARWDAALRDDTGAADLWRLARRERLSAAEEPDPVYRLLLEPERDVPHWTPGAIADVALLAPDGSPQRRSYSVASLPESGAVELILRRRHDAEGLPGLGSAWLTAGLAPGGAVRMSLRDNPTLPALQAAAEADRPLLLIATGTGLAAVLGPLRQRLAAPGQAPLWLIHGERLVVPAPLRALQETAPPRLRVDALLSRGPEPLRLPEWLDRHRAALGEFVAQGATIHVCGSRAPGTAVLEALDAILPRGTRPLGDQGRLLTDLY